MKFPRAYVPQPYRRVNVGGRLLLVPGAEDRRIQQELYAEVRELKPVSWNPERIQQRIRDAFRQRPDLLALRTDIQNCFGTIPQNRVRELIEALPLDPLLKENLLNVIQPVPQGLPTGSPLSPWLAELVLQEVDAAMTETDHYFRYVDDICVLGDRQECDQTIHRLKTILQPLGMSLNKAKTCIVSQEDLVFLGRSYRKLEDALLLEIDLGGGSFRLPNEKRILFRVNTTGQPYSEAGGHITYSLSCILHRMSQQPTPYILEMLMLKPACEDASLRRIIQDPELIIDKGLPAALHGKIYRHYIHRVREQASKGPSLPIGAAGEVFRWLHLANNIMQTGRLPEDYSGIEGDWVELLASLQTGDYAPYHARIKQLFKQEYALRNGNPPLPEIKRAFVEID
jgi:hypothetical protein